MDIPSFERRIATALLAALASLVFPAFAQPEARSRPPGTRPLEEVPPPPPLITEKPEPEPQVSTRTGEEGETIQEYRVNGKLYMRRVTPKHGKAYVLIDHKGDGTFTRQDSALENLKVPQWVLMTF